MATYSIAMHREYRVGMVKVKSEREVFFGLSPRGTLWKFCQVRAGLVAHSGNSVKSRQGKWTWANLEVDKSMPMW